MIFRCGFILGQLALLASIQAAQAEATRRPGPLTIAQQHAPAIRQTLHDRRPTPDDMQALPIVPYSDEPALENFAMPTGEGFGPSPAEIYSRAVRTPSAP
jgi:hypothetical protein